MPQSVLVKFPPTFPGSDDKASRLDKNDNRADNREKPLA